MYGCASVRNEVPIKKNRGTRILVVDDEPAVGGTIKLMLEHEGYKVQIATSSKEALTLLEVGTFDLVITDYAMPEMKGDKLAAAVKKMRPHLPVIMITAHADVLKASGNPLTGVDVLIDKPFLLEDLREGLFLALPAGEIAGVQEPKPEQRPDGTDGRK